MIAIQRTSLRSCKTFRLKCDVYDTTDRLIVYFDFKNEPLHDANILGFITRILVADSLMADVKQVCKIMWENHAVEKMIKHYRELEEKAEYRDRTYFAPKGKGFC